MQFKTEKYTAEVSEEKTCILLKFQKKQNYTVQKGKIAVDSSSFRSTNLYEYTAQVPEAKIVPF